MHEPGDPDDPAPARPVEHGRRRLVRLLVLRLLPTRAEDDLHGSEREAGVDQAATDVPGALSPLLRCPLFATLVLVLGQRLYEPPDGVAAETDRQQREHYLAPRVSSERLQSPLPAGRLAARSHGHADREHSDDRKRGTLRHQASAGERGVPATARLRLLPHFPRRVLGCFHHSRERSDVDCGYGAKVPPTGFEPVLRP